MFAHKIRFHEEVEEIKRNYCGFENQRYQLLLLWCIKYESKATYRIILLALSELNQIDALDKVCELLHSQKKPGRPLASALEIYSDQLKRRYSSRPLKTIVDWPPLPEENNIVKLAMIGNPKIDETFIGDMTRGNVQGVLKTKQVIEPDHFYKIIEAGSGKVFLLEGAPGSGKSTMCWSICKRWSQGTLLKQFTHVLMVELRDKKTQASKSLLDMLPYFSGQENRVAEDLKKRQGENVLIILEGWNELPEHVQDESIFKDMIAKNTQSPLPNSVVLVSSRSDATVDLHCFIEIRIEALGFTPDQIKVYINECFRSRPHKAQELLQIIDRNPKVRENCYLPLMLIIVVHLFHCRNTLPESFCTTIMELALSCLFRYCKQNRMLTMRDKIESFKDIPVSIQDRFCKLCELAYTATLEGRYSFSDSETDGLGLLQSVRSIAARGSEVTQYFLHSSLQELCAALHVSRQPVQVQREMIKQLLKAPKDYVLRFYSADTHLQNEGVSEVFFQHSKNFQKKMQQYLLIPVKPQPFSQALLFFPNILVGLTTMVMQVLVHATNTIMDETPFDRDKLIPLMRIGRPELEPLAEIQAKYIEKVMMKLSDESFDPDTFQDVEESAEFKTECMQAVESIMAKSDLDINPATVAAWAEGFHDQIHSLVHNFMENIEPFSQELLQSFGTDEIPKEVIFYQMMQKLQQELVKRSPTLVPDELREKLGLLCPQQQVEHHLPSHIQEQMSALGTEGNFAELIKSLMPQMLDLKEKPDHQKFMKMLMGLLTRHSQTTTLFDQQLMASLIHGREAHNALMLLHCISEANSVGPSSSPMNPLLARQLGASLILAGNLNGSDLLALQNIFQIQRDGRYVCEVKSLHLVTAITPNDMPMVTSAIKASESLKELHLDIGHYDETIVGQILNGLAVRKLKYDWIIPNDEVRIASCKSFCRCLQHNQSLRILDLTGLSLLDVGAIELAKVINTTKIIELKLEGCGIEEEGIKHLSRALETNHFLACLHLNETNISSTALQALSRSLTQNNTLKVLGIAEDPITTELSEENLQEFIVQLCFNSSIVCVILNGKYLQTPSLKQALRLVNWTRYLKQQPMLSVDDDYPKNYTPEMYNDLGIRAWEIRQTASINCSVLTASHRCVLMREIPPQVWTQTFLCCIEPRNMSERKPNSKPTVPCTSQQSLLCNDQFIQRSHAIASCMELAHSTMTDFFHLLHRTMHSSSTFHS